MTKHLLLMRHAKSDWNEAGLTDKERPLNARGRATAPIMAEWLTRQNHMPDLVLCSNAIRTRQTLELLMQHWTSSKESKPAISLPQVHFDDSLYLASDTQLLLVAKESVASLASLDGPSWKCVLVLAHNPGLELLVSQLSDRPNEMPTGAIAIFESSDADGDWPADWTNGKMWNLRKLAKPRELDL
jgi:phosphohistidine phosphatase